MASNGTTFHAKFYGRYKGFQQLKRGTRRQWLGTDEPILYSEYRDIISQHNTTKDDLFFVSFRVPPHITVTPKYVEINCDIQYRLPCSSWKHHFLQEMNSWR
jgi:hypothetical protein